MEKRWILVGNVKGFKTSRDYGFVYVCDILWDGMDIFRRNFLTFWDFRAISSWEYFFLEVPSHSFELEGTGESQKRN